MKNRNTSKTFEEFLLTNDIVEKWQLEGLIKSKKERSRCTPDHWQELLRAQGVLSEEESCRAVAEYFGYPYINLESTTYDPIALKKVTPEYAQEHDILPFIIFGNELSVAFSSVNIDLINAVQQETGCTILPHIATKNQILTSIETQYCTYDIHEASLMMDVAELLENVDESTVVIDLADGIITNAIKYRASDIHIEARESFVRVRFRIDGVLHEEVRLPKEILLPLASRFKVMAGIDVTERRKPQDGRIKFKIGIREYDLRLSTTPTSCGEKMVLRILDKMGVKLDLNEMCFSASISKRIMHVVSSPSGVIFIAGPTGSGKTTTCYSVLNYLNDMDRNIVTIEDPIEYSLPIINQVQVHHDIGLSFSSVLRSVLRQDPDVILVGEIRDVETARVATQAALTGHLVLSTLHTANAIQAVIRLVEMGVEPFMVAPTIVGVLSQRLVRKICPHCRESYEATDREKTFYQVTKQDEVTLYRGAGCEACRGTGYFGRLALHELVVVTDEIKELITRQASTQEIETCAQESGFKSMRYDGLKKALIGLTTIDEVVKVTADEGDLFQFNES